MAACSVVSTFEITITAASYSQLAGLLAGFAFSALIFLISTRIKVPDPQDSFASAVRILIAAFLGLVLSSLGYAVLAGEPSDAQTRSADTEPVVGVGFAIAGALVIYAIVLTLDAAERLVQTPSKAHRQVSSSTRHILAAFVSPLLVFYLYLAIQDYEAARYGPCHGVEPLDWFGISLVITQMVASWFFYPFMLGQYIRANTWEVAVQTTAWTSRLLLLTTFATAVAYAYIDAYTGPTEPISPGIPAACMVIITLATLGLTWQLAYTHDVR
jgi:hypothetical protein